MEERDQFLAALRRQQSERDRAAFECRSANALRLAAEAARTEAALSNMPTATADEKYMQKLSNDPRFRKGGKSGLGVTIAVSKP
jgi:hypothetical protein